MQERHDAAAKVKVGQDRSPFEERERGENARERFHKRKKQSQRDRRSDNEETGGERKGKALGEDEPVHEEQLQIHHGPKDHEGQLCGEGKDEEIRRDEASEVLQSDSRPASNIIPGVAKR